MSSRSTRAAIRRRTSRAASSTSRCRCTRRRSRSGMAPRRRPTGWASRRSPTASACASSSRTTKCSTSSKHQATNMSRLQEYYKSTVQPKLAKNLGLANPMQVPKITKITVNMGVGEAVADKKEIDNAAGDLAKITGQKPLVTRARKSVATFKVRDGIPLGCKVTLRGEHMYEFLDRLISIAMPRIRDFRGVSARSFDGRGNYNFGVREQIIFPE